MAVLIGASGCGILSPQDSIDSGCRWIELNPGDISGPLAVTVIAHRGFAGCFPENTVESIVAAEEIGAPIVELDVRMTRDSVPVLMHDSTVTRTTNGLGYVAQMRLTELRQLNACPTMPAPCQVPTLAEALMAGGPTINFMLDLKAGFPRAALDGIVADVIGADAMARTKLLTGSMPLLRRIRIEHPEVSTAFVYADVQEGNQGTPERMAELNAIGVRTILVLVSDITRYPDLAATLLEANFELLAATVTTREDLLQMHRAGLLNILSDFPVDAGPALTVN